MKRRQFLCAMAVSSVSGSAAALATLPRTGYPMHLVCDERIQSFAPWRVYAGQKISHYHVFNGDVSRLWLNVLRDVWQESNAATIGFTRHAEFFVLSTLAREQGYRVAATENRAQHLSWLMLPGRGKKAFANQVS